MLTDQNTVHEMADRARAIEGGRNIRPVPDLEGWSGRLALV